MTRPPYTPRQPCDGCVKGTWPIDFGSGWGRGDVTAAVFTFYCTEFYWVTRQSSTLRPNENVETRLQKTFPNRFTGFDCVSDCQVEIIRCNSL